MAMLLAAALGLNLNCAVGSLGDPSSPPAAGEMVLAAKQFTFPPLSDTRPLGWLERCAVPDCHLGHQTTYNF
eukprot:SAG31_NODE_5890_length_2272_cov_1.184998_1_plen_72_part_00